MKNNTSLLLFMTTMIFSISAMDNNTDMKIDFYGMRIKDLSALKLQELQQSKERCAALGIGWPADTAQVLEIQPIYTEKNGEKIFCLAHNPRKLNQAVIANNHEEQAILIKKLMTPCFPKFIPFNHHIKQYFDESLIFKTQCNQQSLTINAAWHQYYQLCIQRKQAEIAMADQLRNNKNHIKNICTAWFITGCGIASVTYIYLLLT